MSQIELTQPSGESQSVHLPERAARDLIAVQAQMVETRRILTGDELVSLKGRRLRLEKTFPKWNVFLFSIDGSLDGNSVRGCLFAGQCIMVFAKTFRDALKLANDGVDSTIELLHRQYEMDSMVQAEFNRARSAIIIEDKPHAGPKLNPHQAAIVQLVLQDHLKGKK